MPRLAKGLGVGDALEHRPGACSVPEAGPGPKTGPRGVLRVLLLALTPGHGVASPHG